MGVPQPLLETQGGNPGENSHKGHTILFEKSQPEGGKKKRERKTPSFQQALFKCACEMWMIMEITD